MVGDFCGLTSLRFALRATFGGLSRFARLCGFCAWMDFGPFRRWARGTTDGTDGTDFRVEDRDE